MDFSCLKTSRGEPFKSSGPTHITSIDWNNKRDLRTVAASLVMGVYNQERERQSQGSQPLLSDDDASIVGAIYEYKYLDSHIFHSPVKPPRYVIAFRGNILKPATVVKDIKSDVRLFFNTLEKSHRFLVAWQAVQIMVALVGDTNPVNIWLAGHSLGAAIALLVGRNMVTEGCYLETYLFNPPFLSTPIGSIKSEKVKNAAHFIDNFSKATVALVRPRQRTDQAQLFTTLSEWVPKLYVNPLDPICSEYIGYFEGWEKMTKKGFRAIERLVTQNSVRALVSDKEPVHLLPSANVTINRPVRVFCQDHGIQQWWRNDGL
ncbi:unnamed protein product, partial [Ilex paraguariensis]